MYKVRTRGSIPPPTGCPPRLDMAAEEFKHSPLADDPLLRGVPEIDGHKFLDPALLLSKLGQGGMGAVYRGRHRTLKIEVAVKCLLPHLVVQQRHAIERFEREARLAAELSHQNLVRLYELRQAYGLTYVVLEFVDGETALERVRRKGPLGEVDAARVILAVSRGLSVAHRHPECIIHRDIKPENVLISRRGAVKLADLGLAKAMERPDVSTFATEGLVGTPRYMAPEQWNTESRLTPQVDIWALGATLYFLLTGEHGLRGTTLSAICGEAQSDSFPDPRQIRPELSAEIASIVGRCTRLDPNARPANAVELARELEGFLAKRGSSLPNVSGVVAIWKSLPARIAVGLTLTAIATLWVFAGGDPDRSTVAGAGPPMSASPGVRDPKTGLLHPEGWEILDATKGYGDWASKVREPRSGIVFLLVAPGTFQMGSPPDEPGRGEFETQHSVTITRPYYLAECETTNAQLYSLRPAEKKSHPPEFPVLGTWSGARDFCNEIGCELPTEAQWEFAARAGSSDPFVWGSDPSELEGKANVFDVAARDSFDLSPSEIFTFDDEYADVAPAARFAKNALGFHDMIGNVREWCYDGFVGPYDELSEFDPSPPPVGFVRVLRGGSWRTGPEEARVAARREVDSSVTFANYDCGFRAAKNLPGIGP